ncbi:exosortase family protein XrtF [Flavobacterium sp.]|uniref:exosortase family protein XrtF n=1 Tax=Flavobacterium sp. TaxID=239 RepID=UPI003750D2D1
MKKYFIQYKPFLLFLGKFFLAYFVFTLIYRIYIGTSCDDCIDGITENVSVLTEKLSNLIGVKLSVVYNYMDYNIIYNNKITAKIIEGCNAISVIILFISFVIAFSGKLKQTVLFILVGSLFIYVLNILRIIILSVLLYYYPAQEHILHGVIFPLIIYGAVFILWVIWVNKFSKYVAKATK